VYLALEQAASYHFQYPYQVRARLVGPLGQLSFCFLVGGGRRFFREILISTRLINSAMASRMSFSNLFRLFRAVHLPMGDCLRHSENDTQGGARNQSADNYGSDAGFEGRLSGPRLLGLERRRTFFFFGGTAPRTCMSRSRSALARRLAATMSNPSFRVEKV
jgi:hypothetical protein